MNKRLYILAAAFLFLAGCSEKETDTPAPDGYGYLKITCTPNDQIEVRTATAPSGDEFSLTLSDGTTPLYWASLAAFATENPLLRYGDYTASVAWGDEQAEGPGKAFYTGETEIKVLPRQVVEASITAKLTKALTLVRTTDQFRKYFQDVHFTVVTGSGNSFDYRFASTASPAVPDTTHDIYVLAGTSLSVKGTAFKQAPTSDGKRPQVTFAEQTLDATKVATRHIFEFDAASAGSATLRILLDETLIETVAIEVELNDDAIID